MSSYTEEVASMAQQLQSLKERGWDNPSEDDMTDVANFVSNLQHLEMVEEDPCEDRMSEVSAFVANLGIIAERHVDATEDRMKEVAELVENLDAADKANAASRPLPTMKASYYCAKNDAPYSVEVEMLDRVDVYMPEGVDGGDLLSATFAEAMSFILKQWPNALIGGFNDVPNDESTCGGAVYENREAVGKLAAVPAASIIWHFREPNHEAAKQAAFSK
ncbi:hypothetical protein [Lacipirellula sp.]|uniref:hypothetical protein n=1 Tax=Lacipirellula sp. TaxID=2691419 RepID=UPI003D1523FE